MTTRRKFLQLGSFSLGTFFLNKVHAGKIEQVKKPIVISTWDAGINANKGAWEVLKVGGKAIDAVEQGVMVTENEINCCVGLGANPDREGIVTLDASIMDEKGNCGAVGFLERIKHPISVARRVLEFTPHVMLVGEGAQQFAIKQGFRLESESLSPDAEKAYKEWLKKSEYKPEVNIERTSFNSAAPYKLFTSAWNHDTIGMLALDKNGDLSGSCTTSGMAFKMRGRLGDSPIIGAGLFVDNEVGACVATGLGEEVVKIAGSHLVVEMMRLGHSPEQACKIAVERIIKRNGNKSKEIQVAFLALNKQGITGSYAIQKGFQYAQCTRDADNRLIDAKYII